MNIRIYLERDICFKIVTIAPASPVYKYVQRKTEREMCVCLCA